MELKDVWNEYDEIPAHRLTWVEINLDHLVYNLEQIRKKVGEGIRVCCVVKADAYGCGINAIQLLQDEGVDCFAVAFLDEAVALRQRGIDRADILLLGHTAIDQIDELIDWDIIPTVYQYDFAEALSKRCVEEQCVLPIHIKVDTGMGRIGFRWDDSIEAIEKIADLPGVRIDGVFTHFATADEADKSFTHLQLERYAKFVKKLEDNAVEIPIKHVENSASIIDFDKTIFDMVRPGIILYGCYPSDEVNKEKLPIKPVMALKTEIVQIKTIHAGDSTGYGRQYIAESDRVIATLPVGYADGYTRMLSGKGTEVLIKGQRAPIVGTICMDQCMVDITDLDDVELYDEVELFGENLPIEELGDRLGTISYELMCMINKRVPRIYKFMGEKELEVELLNDGYFGGL